MGYRELLKQYIRFLEMNVGDNFIEAIAEAPESILSARDIGELKTLAGEIFRESHDGMAVKRVANFNYRLRLLLNRFNLTAEQLAEIAGTDPELMRRYRTHPRSPHYQPLSEAAYLDLETAVWTWLDESDSTEQQLD